MTKKGYKREIHDAFENDKGFDFQEPTTEELDVLSGVEEDLFGQGPPRELIEHLAPSKMRPDTYQPRPILPVEIHARFHTGEIDCYQAARVWLNLAKKDDGHKKRVDELIALANTVEEHGQIKPITGHWIPAESGEGYLFQIETGERRFWGACLLSSSKKLKEEPSLRVEPIDNPSLERQIIENRHAEPPSVVAQAREIAGLILHHLKKRRDGNFADSYDYFRQVRDLPDRDRLPKGFWAKVQNLMQLTPRRMRQIISILDLPTPILEKADRYDLSYRVIAAVQTAPGKIQESLMDKAIEENLSGDEVLVIASQLAGEEQGPRKRPLSKPDPAKSALRGLRGFSNAFMRVPEKRREGMMDDLADEIMVSGEAPEVVTLLEELTKLVRARLKRK